jgi:hypothetical protein
LASSPNNPTGRYILDEHNQPVEEPDLIRWAMWMESADRHVRDSFQGDVRVSTVFLGLDHSFRDTGPPILFETMVFLEHDGIEQERYSTWAEAEEGHARWVAQVFKATPVLALPKGRRRRPLPRREVFRAAL